MGCCQSDLIESDIGVLKKFSQRNQFKMRAMVVGAQNQKDFEDIRSLVECGYQVNMRMPCFQFSTILHVAAEFGELRLVEFLVEKLKCKVNIFNSVGAPPVFYAMKRGKFDIVEYLILKGAKINVQTKFYQRIDDYLPEDRKMWREANQILKRNGFKFKKKNFV